MKYIIYARKSTESEERQILSLEGQIKRVLDRFPDIQDYDVVTEMRSAYTPDNRPVFYQALKDLKKGKYHGLIAWHPDRLSRNPIDAGMIIHYLDRGWIKDLRFVSYSFDNSPEGKMVLNITLSQSKYASEKMAVDVIRNMELKAQKGGWNHKAPVGYLNDMQKHEVILDKERASAVQKIFKMRCEGYAYSEIAGTLNDSGFRMPSGLKLTPRMAWKVVHNRFYAGFVTWRKTEYRGSHTPLVSVENWHKANQTRVIENIPSKRYFPFRNLVKCAICGSELTSEVHKGKYVYYKCSKGNGKCSGFIREEALDKKFAELLSRIRVDDTFMSEAKAAIRTFLKNEQGHKEAERERIGKHIASLEKRKAALLDKLLDGVVANDVYELKSSEIVRDIEKANEGYGKIHRRSVQDYRHIEQWLELMFRLTESYNTAFLPQKGFLLRSLNSNYILTDGVLALGSPKPHLKVVRETVEMYDGRGSGAKLEIFRNMVEVLFEHLDTIKSILAEVRIEDSYQTAG